MNKAPQTQPASPMAKALMAALAASLIAACLMAMGAFEDLEMKALDHRQRVFDGRHHASSDIVIVTIDQNSIDYLKHRMRVLWKWPRDVYAHVVRYAAGDGARAIYLDFDFSDPDITRAEFEEGQTDSDLGQALGDAGHTVALATFYPTARLSMFDELKPADEDMARHAVKPEGTVPVFPMVSVIAPIPPILKGATALGGSNVFPDHDGIIRRMPLFFSYEGRAYPSGSLALAIQAAGANTLRASDGALEIGGKRIALGDDRQFLLSYYGPGGPEGKTYRYIPISDVFLSAMQKAQGAAPALEPGLFKGKIVLIGSNAPSLYDLKATPFSAEGVYPGVEIVATAVDNLTSGVSIRRESTLVTIAAVFIVSLLTALAAFKVKRVIMQAALVGAGFAGFMAYGAVMFHYDRMVNVVPAIAGIALAYMGAMTYNYFTEGKEKRRVRSAFTMYVSEALLNQVMADPDRLKLGGERRELTILFSDIRGFTSISEKLEPETLTHFLNDYLSPMTDIVFKNRGTLDKYIGDAVMAIFGAPVPIDDHAAAGCRTTLEMMAKLRELRAHWKAEGRPDYMHNLNIGIALNTGPVSVGNMGSTVRFDYTVIGDNVNLSSRLESSTKLYGVNIMVSESTRLAAGEGFVFRELDKIKVVGKTIPIPIYELVAFAGTPEAEAAAPYIAKFHDAIAHYRNREWYFARRAFEELYHERPTDKAAKLYIDRCDQYRVAPPPPNWDGSFERREK